MVMKKLLSLLLILLLLSGCGVRQQSPPSPPEDPQSLVSEQEPEPIVEPPDLDSVAVGELTGFYDLTALPQLEGLSVSSAALSEDGKLYLLTGGLGNQLIRFDLNTGELDELCTISVPDGVDWPCASLVSVNPLVVTESAYAKETAYAVSEDGAVTCVVSTEEGFLDQWHACFTESACIWLNTETSQLMYAPLSGAPSHAICQIPSAYYYAKLSGLTADGAEAVVSAERGNADEVLLTLSLDTGEITHEYRQGNPDPALTLTGKTALLAIASDDWSQYQLTAQDARREVMAQLDLSRLIDGFDSSDGLNWGLSIAQDHTFWGQALIVLDNYESERRLLLWDYGDQSFRMMEAVQPDAYIPPDPVTFEELEERINHLEQTYGISIYTGENVHAPYPDYTLSPCEDANAADAALDALEATFALYPEDYFRQLGGESIRGFNFYLCGKMTPMDPSANIDSPGGLSCLVDGVELLAFDITGYVRVQDVVHELTHVLDHWLWEGDVLDEEVWSSMNPEDFTYYYAYVNPEGESYEWAGSEKYTTWDEAYYSGDNDSVYFIDPYSTTYPTEDRARLMEYLLSDPESGPPDYFESVHVQEKLSYLFRCIRSKFDDSAWPEQTSWEAALAQAAREK